MTKHGVVMHCRHCGEAGHNSGGCKLKRDGVCSKDAKRMVAEAQQPIEVLTDEPPHVLTQDVLQPPLIGSQLMSQLSSTMFSQMMDEAPRSSMLSQPQGPLPDSQFILDNRPAARLAPLTTCTKEGQSVATKKRKIRKKNDGASTNKKVGVTFGASKATEK